MERLCKRLTLADGILADWGGPRTAGLLQRLDPATPWQRLAAVVKPLYRNTSNMGSQPNVLAVVTLI